MIYIKFSHTYPPQNSLLFSPIFLAPAISIYVISDTPLIWSCLHGHEAVVDLMIAMGGDINAVSQIGTSCLLVAAMNGHTNIVRTLLRHGANPHIANNNNDLPLHFAQRKNYTAIVDMLRAKMDDPAAEV